MAHHAEKGAPGAVPQYVPLVQCHAATEEGDGSRDGLEDEGALGPAEDAGREERASLGVLG